MKFPYRFILDGSFSEDIITTGMSLKDSDSCKNQLTFNSFFNTKPDNTQAIEDYDVHGMNKFVLRFVIL